MTDTTGDIRYKYILGVIICCLIAVAAEVFVFNFSAFRSMGVQETVIGQNVPAGDDGEYCTENYTVDGEVKNIYVKVRVYDFDTAYVKAILTDEGDKYEYETPEYEVHNDISLSGYSNIYPFGKVHTIRVNVRVPEGAHAEVDTVSINADRPVKINWIRLLIVFIILSLGYLIWTDSGIHNIYLDFRKPAQLVCTAIVILLLLILGKKLVTADPLMMNSPWPHHKQYQELAVSLSEGTVELKNQIVSEGVLNAENPYDTIALTAEGVPYSMDYAYYKGHYYAYFGIVPELLLYYPYYALTGNDLPNYKAVYSFYVLMVIGVFLALAGFAEKYIKSIPYVFYILLAGGTVLCANFVYLTVRTDIYNVPIIAATAFTFMGIGLWLWGRLSNTRWLKVVLLGLGSLNMAMVVGCRPQMALLSLVVFPILLLDEGIKNRKFFNKKSIPETVALILPYILVAIPVCMYNYARFDNILDFGATYSLTTNDMNHRGFNLSRLFRSIYCFLVQPPVINSDFPFLHPSDVGGHYMGRFMSEYTYGGILIANAMLFSLWLGVCKGIKKADKAVKALVVIMVMSGIVVAAFDANAAGVLYRYTCDFAPAFVMTAVLLWMMYLDRGRVLIDYSFVSKAAYICIILSLAYSLLTLVAQGGSVNLANDNRYLYYKIASFFDF